MSNVKPILTVVNAGGHLTQALCMMKVIDEFHLVTSIHIEGDTGAKSVTVIKSTQFNPWIHIKNIFKAYAIIKQIKPASIFSTGGPICLPFAVVAKLMGVNFVYLDTLSRVIEPSNTAKFLYKYNLVNEIFCQWQGIADKYPRMKYVGKTFDIYDLKVQFGSSNIEVMENSKVDSFDFSSREQSELFFKQAKFVFSHCGIGSLYNALKYNTPTIVIPRLLENNEFSDDHQLQIADEIKVNPLILLLDEQSENYLGQFLALIEKYKNNQKQKLT